MGNNLFSKYKFLNNFAGIILLLLTQSCNNSPDNTSLKKDSISNEKKIEEDRIFSRIDSIPVFYLNRDTIINEETFSLAVFTFYKINSQKNVGLAMYKFRGNTFNPIPRYLNPSAKTIAFNNDTIFYGNQDFKRNDWEALTRKLNNNSNLLYAIFDPKLDGENHLYFNIHLVTKGQFDEYIKSTLAQVLPPRDGFTNPSPPDPPQ